MINCTSVASAYVRFPRSSNRPVHQYSFRTASSRISLGLISLQNFYSTKKTKEFFEKRSEPIEIPLHKLDFTYNRCSGPGGQNVNKLNTKAQLKFNIGKADWIPDEVKEIFRKKYENRINSNDEFILTAEEHRTQEKNKLTCIKKLETMLDSANIIPIARLETEKPSYANEIRLTDKKKKSELKRSRKIKWDNDY